MSEGLTSEKIDAIRNSTHQKVMVGVTDIDGVLRGKYIHKEKFLSALDNGFGFCNVVFGWDSGDVCYDNTKYTGWHTGYPDAEVQLDPASIRNIPWDSDTPFVLGDFVTQDKEALAICPRQILKKVQNQFKDAGYAVKVGCEFEWFNFYETPETVQNKRFRDLSPISPGMFGYSVIRSSLNRDFFADIMDLCNGFGIPLEGLHCETGPGVYEAAIMAAPALEAADRAVLFKTAVKEIAYRHDILATFMARWNLDLPGTSGHIHQSISDIHSGEGLFLGANGQMSEIFNHYLAGCLYLLPELLPLFAPNINSYKRLVEGYWAPTRANWGFDNRTVAARVILGSKSSTRLEMRVAGADVNPYLGVAACLAAGLYGIENKLTLPTDPVDGNGYRDTTATELPKNLMEATDKFNQSELARSFFGTDFVDHYCATREWEYRQSQKAITDWELNRYFEII